MNLKECYEQLEGNYDETIQRMMNEAFVERFITKFLDDKTYDAMMTAVDTGNVPEVFKGAHTMKGVAGNLGFTKLAAVSSALTECLRGKDSGELDTKLIEDFKAAYKQVVDAVNSYLASR